MTRRRGRFASSVLASAGFAFGAFVACDAPARDAPDDGEGLLVIEGATVFTSPFSAPIEDGVVVLLDGIIEGVGPRGRVQVPAAARRVDASGLSLMAGFWNAHVRLDPELVAFADEAPAADLATILQEWFLRYGFTTVMETATPPGELAPLLSRIEAGEVAGPRIIAVGGAEVAGIHLPRPGDPPLTGELLAGLAVDDVAVVPALTLFGSEIATVPDRELAAARSRLEGTLAALGAFAAGGGALVFGSGAGYVPSFDPTPDYVMLEDGGVRFDAILASLTTEPSERFAVAYGGEVEPGMVANLVLVEGDPSLDIAALGRVRWVLLGGATVYGGVR